MTHLKKINAKYFEFYIFCIQVLTLLVTMKYM